MFDEVKNGNSTILTIKKSEILELDFDELQLEIETDKPIGIKEVKYAN